MAIDVNPLLVDENGAIALDARVEIDLAHATDTGPNPMLAVRPYPSGWDRDVHADGLAVSLRPIRPTDVALYPDFLRRVTPEDLRLRFLTPMATLSSDALIRLTQLDYDRAIAFVALEKPGGDLAGIVRYTADPDRESAEFGVLVRSDLQGHGLGVTLMEQLIAYAKADGIGRLEGQILSENHRMAELCRQLGFTLTTSPGDGTRLVARLDLRR